LRSLRQGLVGEYLFDGNTEDSSDHRHHGRVEGATLTVNRFGKNNGAYAFSGQGDYIVLDPPPELNVANQSGRVFQLSTKGGIVTWHRMMQSPDSTGKLPIQRDVWYHIIAMFDGVHHKLYVNGELQDVQVGSFKPNTE
jgi:hypothetical protein